jgi:hypothetical protein
MDSIRQLFLGAGWPAYPTLALGIVALALGIAAVVGLIKRLPADKVRSKALWALVMSLATLGMGGIGYWLGMRNVEAAVLGASAEHREELMAYGQAEAFGCLKLALYEAVAPFLMGLIAFLGARSRADAPGGDDQPPTFG